MKIKMIIFIILTSIIPAVCHANDVVIITNKSVSETILTKNELSNIYLGKKSSWSNGKRIWFAVLKGDTHTAFLNDYIGKTESQFNTYWKKQVFTGRGKPPKQFDSDRAIVEFVAQTTGAVGYVSTGADVSKVKTIILK